jgi:integrase
LKWIVGKRHSAELAAMRAEIATLTAAINGMVSARVGPQAAPVACELTFADAFKRYLARHAKEKWAGQAHYKLKRFFEHFGAKRITDQKRGDWYYWRDEIRAKTKTRMGGLPAIGTLNQDYARVMHMLRWLEREDMIPVNPWKDVEKLKGERRRNTEIPMHDLLAAIDKGSSLLAATYLTLYFELGMRKTEIRLMRWREVDFETARHKIPAERTKTATERIVPLSEFVMAQLRKWRASQPIGVQVDNPFVFANPTTGQPYSGFWLWKQARVVLDRLQAAPGDKRVRAHDGRHSATSRLVRGGMPVLSSMKIIGHTDVSMHSRYQHVDDSDRERAKEILDAGRFGPKRAQKKIQTPPEIVLTDESRGGNA